jgi:hypothetical protein
MVLDHVWRSHGVAAATAEQPQAAEDNDREEEAADGGNPDRG